MEIKSLTEVFHRYKGGTLIFEGKAYVSDKIEHIGVGHDVEVFIYTTDETEIFCGFSDVEGVEHEGKFYIDDNRIVLSPPQC